MKRVLSGMRPTGKLHLGHYVGALGKWVELQEDREKRYENFHLVADYHVLTTHTGTADIEQNTLDMVQDWLAVGIDPEKSPIFRQSEIKEHSELFLILSMLVTTARLERNPTLKEQIRNLKLENPSYGHLGYPVLQSADILLYKGDVVPVGEDQSPHVEIARELARRFNKTYSSVFPEPEALLPTFDEIDQKHQDVQVTFSDQFSFGRLPGIDGRAKMSKSLNNAILISDEPETIQKRLKKAFTDPLKIRRNDIGRPDICLVYTYHTRFNTAASPEIRKGCETGTLGCVDCKQRCAEAIADQLAPVRERRRKFDGRPDELRDVLADGEKRAGAVAQETMAQVHEAMGLG